jgi:hypothetical protein
MTAAEHRNEAVLHQRAAEERRQEAAAANPRAVPSPVFNPGYEWNAYVYAPASQHMVAADREMQQAADHLRAARALENFEDKRCASIPKAERAACPLLASSVSEVAEVENGVRLLFKPSVDVVDTYRRLDCHLAYSMAQGFVRPSCPLFVKGMNVALSNDKQPAFIEMASKDGKVANELKEQARKIFRAEVRK